MSAAISLGVATVAMGAYSAYSANKNAKRASNDARQARDSQHAMHLDTINRADDLVDDAKSRYRDQRDDVNNAYDYAKQELERAYRNQDQAAVRRIQNQLENIEAQRTELSNAIGQGESQSNDILAEGDQSINDARDGTVQRLEDSAQSTQDSIDQMGQGADIVGRELNRLDGLGQRPEGLDAAQSDLESNFRDAEANMRRQNGGQLTEAQKLNLEMNKARSKGGLSADMREDWGKYRTGAIGNIASQSSNLQGQKLSAEGYRRAEENQADQMHVGNVMNNNNTKLSSGERFLDRKLAASSSLNDLKFNVQSDHDSYKMNSGIDKANSFIGNKHSALTGNDAALGNLQRMQQSSMGTVSNANGNMANAYANQAAQNSAQASQSRAQVGQAMGQTVGNLATIYGMKQGGYFDKPKTGAGS